MGHEKPLTTLNSYGHVSIERQAEIIRGLRFLLAECRLEDLGDRRGGVIVPDAGPPRRRVEG
jgi:hypothetical protein